MLLITCEIADFLLNQTEGSFTLKVQLLKQKPFLVLMFCGTRSLCTLYHFQNHPLMQVLITLFYKWEKKSYVYTANKILSWDLNPGISARLFFCLLDHCIPIRLSFTSSLPGRSYLTNLNHTENILLNLLPPYLWNRWPIHQHLNSYGTSTISAPVRQGRTTSPIILCTEMVMNCELSTQNCYFCLKIMFCHQSYRGNAPFIKINSYRTQASVWKYHIHIPQGIKVDRKSEMICISS